MGTEDALGDEFMAEIVRNLDRAYARTSPIAPPGASEPVGAVS